MISWNHMLEYTIHTTDLILFFESCGYGDRTTNGHTLPMLRIWRHLRRKSGLAKFSSQSSDHHLKKGALKHEDSWWSVSPLKSTTLKMWGGRRREQSCWCIPQRDKPKSISIFFHDKNFKTESWGCETEDIMVNGFCWQSMPYFHPSNDFIRGCVHETQSLHCWVQNGSLCHHSINMWKKCFERSR